MEKIRVGIVGVGNCFAGLYQGLEYYRQNPDNKVIGIMHEKFGAYSWDDLEFVSAFDVGKNKIGKPLHEAVYCEPNKVKWLPKMPESKCVVSEGPALDGVGIWVQNKVDPIKSTKTTEQLKTEILAELKRTKTQVIVNYLPVGSQKATEFWAGVAMEAKCAMVNCMPVFIASGGNWGERFAKAGVPIIGDDIKGLVGATIVHRTLARLCDERGAKIVKTYQINVGGNSVTGDQEILLVHNGKTIKTKIGDFVDHWIEVYGQKRDDGKDIVDMSITGQRLECFTVDENFGVVPAEVAGLVRHNLNEELYEIETDEGRKIRITKDHNVFVLGKDGSLHETRVCDLKENETRIAVPKGIPIKGTNEAKKISLLPYLKELFAQGIDSNGNIAVHNHPELRIPVELEISDELLQVAGMWVADGSFDREGSANMEIACGNDPECMTVINGFASAYGINYKVRGQKQVSVRIMSKTMAKIFRLALGFGGNSYTKRIPGWVFGLSERQISLFLKGYMSGDGCVTGRQIRWTTASEGLAEDIRTLSLMVGIDASLFREDYSEKNEKGSYRTNLKYITHGAVSSKEGVERFIEKVGFLQDYKNRKALEASRLLARGGMRIIPKIDLFEKWGVHSKSWKGMPTLRAHIVARQLDKVRDEAERKRISAICLGDTLFLKIKNIFKLDAKPQYVYDLNVPEYQRFICSNILVHNTDFLNMKEQERLESKKISKTESVQSQLKERIPDENIYVGPSDFVPFLGNTKLMFMRIEGLMWSGLPFNMEVRLEVDDKANSAGIVIDAVRAAKIALDRGIGGPVESASAYLMKHPPKQYSDPEARELLEKFISGKE